MKMRIRYKKRLLNIEFNFRNYMVSLVLYFGVLRKKTLNWTDYGWIVISLMYLGMYFYQKNYNYLTIENGIIKVNGPFGKKLNLIEIKRIKKFAGDYILKTDEKELAINTQIINPSSLAELNAELEKLNVEWT